MDKKLPTPHPYEHLTIKQAATYLDVSIKTLRRWDNEGRLNPVRNRLNHRLYDLQQLRLFKLGISHSYKGPKKPQEEYLTISQAAAKLQVSVKTLRRWEKSGKINSSRNQFNQRLYTRKAIESARNRIEAERYLPQITRETDQYWRTWPAIRSLLVGSGMVIATMLLLVLSGATKNALIEQPSLIVSTPRSPNLASNLQAVPLNPLSAFIPENLELTDHGPMMLNLEKTQIPLEENLAPPLKEQPTSIDQPPIDLNSLLSEAQTPLATDTARMLITSIISEYLAQYSSGIVDQDLNLSPSTHSIVAPILASMETSQDQLTTTTASPTSLPPANLDTLGNLAPHHSASPDQVIPTTTPSPIPQSQFGEATIPAKQNVVEVIVPHSRPGSIISITFQADYAPATRYWVTSTDTGFSLHLDQPVTTDTPFSWTIFQ